MNIICDLDGTIALDTGRAHHLHTSDCPKKTHPEHETACICLPAQRDWPAYFDACDTDEPNDAVIELLRMSFHKHKIYILSGRSQTVAEKTALWIQECEVPFHYMQMRSPNDRTDDHKLKLKWAEELGLTPENTLFVLEDRTRVVDAWRAKGFRCFQVAPGNF